MKQTFSLILLSQFAIQTSFSQNIGIGTLSPQSKLDINGDIAFRSTDLTISTTYTYDLNVNTIKQANYKLKQPILPIGNFILAGITAGVEGRLITLTNRTTSSMEIYNEDVNATTANRIQTGTGNTVAIYPNGNVTLQYDATDQRWSIKSMHNNSLNYFGGGGGGSSYWDLSGQNISNTNTGNVGIGTNSPSFKLDVTGNQRINGTPITSPGLNGDLTTGGSLRVGNNGNNFFLKTDGGKLQAEKLNIQNITSASTLSINPHGGNVGIGIDGDIPYKLSIYQPTIESNSNTHILQLRGQNPLVNFADQFNTSRGYIKGITNNSQTQYPGVGIAIGASDLNDGAGNFGDIYLLGKGYQPSITIKGTNNRVGIGLTNPTAKLDVQGDFRISGAMYEPFLKIGISDFSPRVYHLNYNLSNIKNIIVDIPNVFNDCSSYYVYTIYLPDPFPGNIYGNYLGQILNISLSRNTLDKGRAFVQIKQNTSNGDVVIGIINLSCQNNISFRPVAFIKLICDGSLWQPIEGGFSIAD